MLRAVAHLSRDAAHAATFTASGEVRRSLERVGFKVLKRPGFGRKRECLHGVLDPSQASNEEQVAPVRPTAWDQPACTEKPQSCLILGAGLAGSHIARRLAERNCNVTVLERGTIGSGGSTQPQGVIYTRPSHKHGKLADFSLTAYEFSVDHHQRKFREGSLEEASTVRYQATFNCHRTMCSSD